MHLAHLESFSATPIVFFTVCTHERRPILACREVHECLAQLWADSAECDGWCVGHYVLMPDHVHLFARPSQDAQPMAKWIGMWKAVSARRIGHALRVSLPVWQRDYFDRYVRSSENYEQKWEYVVSNPVRAGLTDSANKWPYQGMVTELRG